MLVLLIIAGIIGFVLFYFIFSHLALWLQALVSGAKVGLVNIIFMRLRKVPAKLIVESKIMAVKAGIEIPGVDTSRLVSAGASPRGLSYLVRAARVAAWLDGRSMAVPEDVRAVFFETMAHRIFFEPVYEMRRESIARELIDALFETVPVP